MLSNKQVSEATQTINRARTSVSLAIHKNPLMCSKLIGYVRWLHASKTKEKKNFIFM
jgi:hypothetical protein